MVLASTMTLTTGPGTTNQTTGKTTGGSTSNRDAFIATGFSMMYSAQSGYRVSDTAYSASFGAGNFTSETVQPDYYPTVLYSSVNGAESDYLALYKYRLDSPLVIPRYGGTGGWQHSITFADSKRTRVTYFSYGTPTPVQAIPKTGSMRFFMLGGGNHARDAGLYYSTCSGYLTVNYATGEFDGNLTPSGQNFYEDSGGGLPGLRFRGTLSGGSFEGAAISNPGVVTRFRMSLVGPDAEEFILTYFANVGFPGYTSVGACVGVPNP